MIRLLIDNSEVLFDTLDAVRNEAVASGRGVAFWRETLTACAQDDGAWNDLLNGLWQSGGEREAERLDRLFGESARRHWLLIALELCTEDSWSQFLSVWRSHGDGIVDEVVKYDRFMPWLKDVQPVRHALMNRVFGTDSWRWEAIYLAKAFLRMNDNDLLMADGSQAFRFVKCIEAAFDNPKKGAAAIVGFLETGKADFLVEEGKEREIGYWKQFIDPEPGAEMSITLPGDVQMIFCWCPATTNSEGFWMGKLPVMKKQWIDIMGSNPGNPEDVSPRSSAKISQKDCVKFIEKVNAENSIKVHLPTKVQWEHAHRVIVEVPSKKFDLVSAINRVVREAMGTCWGVCGMHDFDSEWNWDHEIGLIGAMALKVASMVFGDGKPTLGGVVGEMARVASACSDTTLRKFRLVCSVKPHR